MQTAQDIIRLGDLAWDAQEVILALAGAAVALLFVSAALLLALLLRRGQKPAVLLTELAELKGRIQGASETFVQGQSQLALAVHEKLDGLTHRLGQDLSEASRVTGENLARLGERLAVIDHAQQKIGELSSHLFTLQTILSDKQQRGAFGQGRMEAIVQDALPPNAYSFQATLSNGKRPDCLIHIPHAPALAIDAKFPLEGFEALRRAEGGEAQKQAAQQVRQDVSRHIGDIASKYRIEGETQRQTLLFVPVESVFLELHEHFPDLLQKAAREGVMIVSPSLLMLAVQTLVGILKDARMREQASQIQKEVSLILEEVAGLHERALRLQAAFRKLSLECESVVTTAQRLASRAGRIGQVELE